MSRSSVILALLLQVAAGNEQQVATGTIAGTVIHGVTGQPLPNVRVTLAKTDVALGAFASTFSSDAGSTDRILTADMLAALRSAFEGETFEGGASPEAAARARVLRSIPSNALEIISSPANPEPAVVLASSPPVLSDERGNFVFDNLQPGTYRLYFAGISYARQQYGQVSAFSGGLPIALTTGQNRKDLVMRLFPTGALSGRIRDVNGQPATGVPVQLFRFSYDETGSRRMERIASTFSDDRGDYRMFHLAPGRYYLSAGNQPGETPAVGKALFRPGYVSTNRPERTYGLTYFPGIANQESAGPIDLQPGADLRVSDMVVSAPHFYHVRGRIVDPSTGRPPQAIRVTLRPRANDLSFAGFGDEHSPRYNNTDGTFEINNVNPGVYTLTATPQSGGVFMPDTSSLSPAERSAAFESMTAADQARPRASTAISIVNADVSGIVLTMNTSKAISGRFRIDGPDPGLTMQFSLLNVELKTPAKGRVWNMTDDPMFRPALADGIFRIDNVLPGEYRLSVIGVPQGFYIKDALLGDTDVLNGPFRFSETGTLDIVFSPNVATVRGSVTDAGGKRASGSVVVLIPNEKRSRAELFRSAITDSEGQFNLSSVAPGDYTIAAWEGLESFGFFDPGVIAAAEQLGKAIRIAESSSQTVTLSAIPKER